jgi:hypothetical protein
MTLSLAEALRLVNGANLQPGQTYHERVNGKTVEVRVLEDNGPTPEDDGPTPELMEQVMLQPWVEFPFNATGTVRAQPGQLPLPDPPVIPEDDEVSE